MTTQAQNFQTAGCSIVTKSAAMHQRLAREIADVMARRARPSYGTRVRGALRKILLVGKPTGKSSARTQLPETETGGADGARHRMEKG